MTPSHITTQAPKNPEPSDGLERRAGDEDETTLFLAPDETCGYIGGNELYWYSCADSRRCQFYTSSEGRHGWQACCNNYLNCQPLTTCLNYDKLPAGTVVSAGTVACDNSDYPICQTLYEEFLDARAFLCGPSGALTSLDVRTTYIGQPEVFFVNTTLGGATTELSSETTMTDTPLSAPTPSIGASPTGEPADDGGSGGTPVGAIVGGVVGGFAVLAIAAAAIFMFLHKQRQKSPGPAAGMSQVAEQPAAIGQYSSGDGAAGWSQGIQYSQPEAPGGQQQPPAPPRQPELHPSPPMPSPQSGASWQAAPVYTELDARGYPQPAPKP